MSQSARDQQISAPGEDVVDRHIDALRTALGFFLATVIVVGIAAILRRPPAEYDELIGRMRLALARVLNQTEGLLIALLLAVGIWKLRGIGARGPWFSFALTLTAILTLASLIALLISIISPFHFPYGITIGNLCDIASILSFLALLALGVGYFSHIFSYPPMDRFHMSMRAVFAVAILGEMFALAALYLLHWQTAFGIIWRVGEWLSTPGLGHLLALLPLGIWLVVTRGALKRLRRPKIAPVTVGEGTIEEDILCRGCGYNLRTLPMAGICPECGLPVAQTQNFREHWRFLNLQQFSVGSALLATPSLAICLYIFLFYLPIPSPLFLILVLVSRALGPIILGYGAWLVRAAAYGKKYRALIAGLVIIELMAALFEAGLYYFVPYGSTFYEVAWGFLQPINLAAFLAHFALLVMAWILMHRIAKRVGSASFMRWTHIAFGISLWCHLVTAPRIIEKALAALHLISYPGERLSPEELLAMSIYALIQLAYWTTVSITFWRLHHPQRPHPHPTQ